MGTNGEEYYIFVNSDDRIRGDPLNRVANPFTVEIKNLNFMYNRNVKIGLDEAYFTHLQYPVRSTNNKFKVSLDGINYYNVTIPEGSYTPSQLVATLITVLDTAVGSPTFTVTFDNITKKLTFAVNTFGSFYFDFTGRDSAWKILGFGPNTIDGYLLTGTAPHPVQIDTDFAVYLETSFAGTNVLTTYTGSIFEVIALGVPYGGIVNYKSNESNNFETVQEARLSRITFTLRNPDGSLYQPEQYNAQYIFKLRVIATDYNE